MTAAAALGMAAAICLGEVLRFWGLLGAVIFGDELHAIQSAVGLDLKQILTTYRMADHCIPMAAYDRLLVASGVRLTELLVRMPSVIAGLGTLVALPLAVARVSDRGTAIVFGWLLALSPTLIYYSRIARPYAIVVLLGFGAAASFWAFRQTRRPLWGGAYAVLGAAAAWFHPGVAPFVIAPLVFVGVEALVGARSERRRRLAEATGLGALLATFIALYLVPGLRSFLRLLEAKSSAGTPELVDVAKVLLVQSGSMSPGFAVLFWLVVGCGFVYMGLRNRPLALYTATLVLGQAAAVGLFRPSGVDNVLVLNRYMLITLPATLLWAAFGLTALWCLPRGRLAGRAVVTAFVVWLVATHPYVADPWLRLGPLSAGNAAVAFFRAPPEVPAALVPDVYRLLGREPGRGAVVEIPSEAGWYRARAETDLARVHGRPVIFARPEEWLRAPAVSLRSLVSTAPGAVLASGARFVVLDLNRYRLWRTIVKIRLRGLDPDELDSQELERLVPMTAARAEHARLARRMAARFEAAWGPPQLVDGTIRVWDLAVVRGR